MEESSATDLNVQIARGVIVRSREKKESCLRILQNASNTESLLPIERATIVTLEEYPNS